MIRLEPPAGAVVQRPDDVRLTFTEPVTPFGRGIEVFAPSGQLLHGAARANANQLVLRLARGEGAEEGTYRVQWRVVAQDTHPSRGAYSFSVGHPSAPPGPGSPEGGSVPPTGLLLQALARWLHFIGYALTFGVLVFQFVVIREAVPGARLRRLVHLGIVLLVLAEPVALVGQAASLGSIDSGSTASALGSTFGRLLALRAGAALALWGLIATLDEARWRGAALVAALGVALALVDGLGAHTLQGIPPQLALLLTGVHMGAMGVWFGGVAALLALGAGKAGYVGRFSRVASGAAAALIISGALLALAHLGRPSDLAYTAYGLAIALKVLAVGVALIAAWLGLRSGRSGRPELVALVGVLALAGLLAALPPPR